MYSWEGKHCACHLQLQPALACDYYHFEENAACMGKGGLGLKWRFQGYAE